MLYLIGTVIALSAAYLFFVGLFWGIQYLANLTFGTEYSFNVFFGGVFLFIILLLFKR